MPNGRPQVIWHVSSCRRDRLFSIGQLGGSRYYFERVMQLLDEVSPAHIGTLRMIGRTRRDSRVCI